ncbi:hypothetical protein PHYBOEH_002787 [Phytophthora boehmeriae]|uniref:RxLR effector protein n=1 Tax=Phytophthora boehmeriae TaxID=109152 RepID=A0A8T1WRK8_9STRA|nr:hypothetical protein PHYBOEH_002787 [Phytophthora boehmeriae]
MTKSNLHNGGKRYLRTEETLETDDIDSDEEERKAGVDITKVLIGPKIEKLNKAAVQAAKASTVERATAAKLAERSKILRKAIDKAMQSDKLTDAAFAIWNKQGVMASTLLRQLDPSLRAKYKPFLRSYNEYVQKALTTS